MDKGKLLPLVLAAILFIVAISIFINNQKNSKHFDKLIVSYKTQNSEYNDLHVDDVIVIDNVSFWVVSTVKDSIVLNSSSYVYQSEEEILEFEIELNKSETICLSASNCIVFSLL